MWLMYVIMINFLDDNIHFSFIYLFYFSCNFLIPGVYLMLVVSPTMLVGWCTIQWDSSWIKILKNVNVFVILSSSFWYSSSYDKKEIKIFLLYFVHICSVVCETCHLQSHILVHYLQNLLSQFFTDQQNYYFLFPLLLEWGPISWTVWRRMFLRIYSTLQGLQGTKYQIVIRYLLYLNRAYMSWPICYRK